MVYRYCIVPFCKSTTISTPGKTFIKLPLDEKRRRIWLKAMRRQPKDISSKSHVYVCEEHFNLEQDMENYMEWKMMGVQKRMKTNVVPHIFTCQDDNKRTCPQPVQETAAKRARQSTIQDVLCEASTSRSHLPTQEFLDRQHTVGVQVNLRNKFRSKYIQCNIQKTTVCQSCSSNSHLTSSVALSPIKLQSAESESLFRIVKMEEPERSLFHADTSNDCNVLPSHTPFNLPNDTVMEDAFTDGPLDLKEEPKLLEINHTELEMHQICICCLGTDNVSNMKDIFIDGIPSVAIYEKISNIKVEMENISVGMCLQCIGELAKIDKFIDMSKRSYTVFSRAAQEIKEMNNQEDINAEQYKIKKTNILKDVLGKNHVLPCESDKMKLHKKSTRESCVLQKDLPRKGPVKSKENLLENTSLNIDKEKTELLSKEIVQDICPLCLKQFRHLIEHLHSIHSLDWNNSKCLQCSYTNTDKDKLVKHCKECSNIEFKYDNSDYFETKEVKLEWTEETDECDPNFEPDELERDEMEEIGAEAEQLKNHSNTKETYLLCNMEV